MTGSERIEPDLVGRSVGALVFDWDGTAVPNRRVSARRVRVRLERLSALGIHVAVVSGTHVGNIDAQLQARPPGPGRLFLALNRGSELFEVTAAGPVLLQRRPETPELARSLDEAAERLVRRLSERGLVARIDSTRLNRRKVDLIPEPAWADPPKAVIAELLAAVDQRVTSAGFRGLGELAGLATSTALECGVPSPRVTSDAKHLEIGVTDKSDSMRELLVVLGSEGVCADLVLVVGDEFGSLGGVHGSDALLRVPEAASATYVSVGVEPAGVPPGVIHVGGGPDAFLVVVDEQLRRAADLRVPSVSRDPRWTIVERGVNPLRHRVTESLFTTTSGAIGMRGSVEEGAPFGSPLVVANGVYRGAGTEDGLLPGPDVFRIQVDPPVREDLRMLDLRTGLLYREEVGAAGAQLRSARFGSISEPGVFAFRVEAGGGRIHTPRSGSAGAAERTVSSASRGSICAASVQRASNHGGGRRVERLVAFGTGPREDVASAHATELLAESRARGFEQLLAAQRSGWASRWDQVTVELPSDPEVERGLRFALFQLWGLGSGTCELAVGARGLTGPGYAGHVFWDADIFVLPALVTIDPDAAAGLVNYRYRRLQAARRHARETGHHGARFPWESALDGSDVTPVAGWIGGQPVPILTGRLEEHITADVAWAAHRLEQWTRPAGRPRTDVARLLGETARYWASRVRIDAERRAHIDRVIGPDEYHESVDDNAFTNVMARWNLRTASRWATADDDERLSWQQIADSLVDGYQASSGLYEQFRGYFALEDLRVRDLAEPPVAADVLAGRDRIAGSQVIKQPDVLMLHHLVPEETEPGSLVANLDFYGPRTAHGSSLSPSIMAALEARAARPDAALDLLRMSLRIDLEDLGGTTSAGVHVGACAGAWQALLLGFLGVRVHEGTMEVDPVLPAAWPEVEVRFLCLGRAVRIRVAGGCLHLQASSALRVRVGETGGYRPIPGDHIQLVEGTDR